MIFRARDSMEAEVLFSISSGVFACIHYLMTSLSVLNCCFKVRKQASMASLLEQ